MKKIILIIFAMIAVAAMVTETAISKPTILMAVPEFNWTNTTYNFGRIKVGEAVSHEFAFTNKGDSPLIISSVKASCGCTVTDYSRNPINPGDQGYVYARYDASKPGTFSKPISVMSNAGDVIVLTIRGEVVE